MHGKKVATCPRHDKYPGEGSETFSVQAELLHIWRCRHEYNPPTPTPTYWTHPSPLPLLPSHATNFHPVLHEGNEAASERASRLPSTSSPLSFVRGLCPPLVFLVADSTCKLLLPLLLCSPILSNDRGSVKREFGSFFPSSVPRWKIIRGNEEGVEQGITLFQWCSWKEHPFTKDGSV